MDDLVRFLLRPPRAETTVDARINSGSKSSTTSAQVAVSQTLTTLPPWVCNIHSRCHAGLLSADWVKGKQAITEPSEQLPSAC